MIDNITNGDKNLSLEETLDKLYLFLEMAENMGYGPRTTLGREINEQIELVENVIENNNRENMTVRIIRKAKFSSRVRDDIISIIENMLSEETILLLNKTSYNKGEISNKQIHSNQKRKNTSLVNVNLKLPNEEFNLDLQLTELYTKVEHYDDYKTDLFYNTILFNDTVLKLLTGNLLELLNNKNIELTQETLYDLYDNIVTDINLIKCYTSHRTYTGKILTRSKHKAILELVRYTIRNKFLPIRKDRFDSDTLEQAVTRAKEVLNNCFNLDYLK